MKITLVFFTFVILSLLSEFSIPEAFAYIDPGSGSVIIQMIIGALVGIGVAMKVFWYKIKSKLFSAVNKKKDNDGI